tara:strand:- start:21727 stop:22041 length:315 start_codon:yes stop_codon:yes gene_type:complete
MHDVLFKTDKIDCIKIELTANQLLEFAKRTAEETAKHLLQVMENEKNPEFITQKEAMSMLGISSPNTIKRRVKEGYFSSFRIGNMNHYRKDEILNALERERCSG